MLPANRHDDVRNRQAMKSYAENLTGFNLIQKYKAKSISMVIQNRS